MRVAVISDIHANLHALDAVLADVDAFAPDELWCLGDVVGYGPRPNECTAIVREREQDDERDRLGEEPRRVGLAENVVAASPPEPREAERHRDEPPRGDRSERARQRPLGLAARVRACTSSIQ